MKPDLAVSISKQIITVIATLERSSGHILTVTDADESCIALKDVIADLMQAAEEC